MNAIVVTALRRPYTFVVLSILIVVFGIMAVLRTPTDVFPNIKIPVVSVVWTYGGMLPEEFAGRIIYNYELMVTSTVEGSNIWKAVRITGAASSTYTSSPAPISARRKPRSPPYRRRLSSSCPKTFHRPWS
ncbi:efflux RND transporter permease subunit [Komagataeibacter rhaeticus]|nr:efflux RND transporter permease subunit [Komagataeibacter rhaeticus]